MLIFLTISLVSCGLAFPIMYKTKLLSLEQMMVRLWSAVLKPEVNLYMIGV